MRYEDEIVGKDAVVVEQGLIAKKQNLKDNNMRGALVLLRDVLIAVAVLILILQFYKPTIVFEHSMEDTLHPEDYVFLAKRAYTFGEIKFGDIIVFDSKLLNERGIPKSLIKRVIGLPDDVIEVRGESVFRNGKILDEPYVKGGATPGDMAPVIVPANSYFVMGDNRTVSLDSRTSEVGFVDIGTIKGKVVFRLFPLSSAGIIR